MLIPSAVAIVVAIVAAIVEVAIHGCQTLNSYDVQRYPLRLRHSRIFVTFFTGDVFDFCFCFHYCLGFNVTLGIIFVPPIPLTFILEDVMRKATLSKASLD